MLHCILSNVTNNQKGNEYLLIRQENMFDTSIFALIEFVFVLIFIFVFESTNRDLNCLGPIHNIFAHNIKTER